MELKRFQDIEVGGIVRGLIALDLVLMEGERKGLFRLTGEPKGSVYFPGTSDVFEYLDPCDLSKEQVTFQINYKHLIEKKDFDGARFLLEDNYKRVF